MNIRRYFVLIISSTGITILFFFFKYDYVDLKFIYDSSRSMDMKMIKKKHEALNTNNHLLPQSNVSQNIIDKQKKLLWFNVMKALEDTNTVNLMDNSIILKTNYEEYLRLFKIHYNRINLIKYIQQKDSIQLPYPLVEGSICALVCSAGGILDRNLGEFIDKHDVIFRLNYAPFKGFEKDVGSRTDVRLINNVVAYEMRGNFWNKLYSDEILIMYHCCADNKDQPRGDCLVASKAHHEFIRQSYLNKDKPYYALDCEMWWDANIMMYNVSDLQLPRRPVSTGFMGFLLAYSVCGVLDLFGCIEQNENITYYYSKGKDPSYGNPMGYLYHPFLTEKVLYLSQNLLDDNLTFGHGVVRIIPEES